MGYIARRSNLDTFNVDETTPSNNYPSGKGHLGWKQIAGSTASVIQWELPTPFNKSYVRAGADQNNLSIL